MFISFYGALRKNRGIKTLSSLMIILLITKALGFIKIRLFASLFGLSRELDIFWAAFTVPDTIFNILVAGGFNAGVLPVFSDVQEEGGKREVSHLFWVILFWFSIVLIVISIGMFVIAPHIADLLVGRGGLNALTGISSDISMSDEALLISLMRLMLLSPILLGISNIFTVILQLKRKFTSMMLAPLFYNVGIILGSLFLYRYGFGIWSLAWAVVLGSALHLLSQIFFLFKQKHVSLIKRSDLKDLLFLNTDIKDWFKQIVKLSIPRSIALFIERINVIVNTFIGFTLSAGALSSYKFAYSLHLFPIHIISNSISTIALPDLAESKSKREQLKFIKSFNSSLNKILFLILPITTLVLILRLPIVRLAYGTGKFDWWATLITAWCLFFFSLSILGQSVSGLALRAFYALHDTVTPMLVSIVVAGVNISVGFYFTNFLSHYSDWRPLVLDLFHKISDAGLFNQASLNVIHDIGGELFLWFTTRNGSDFAVGGLAFGLGVAFMVEASLYLLILHKKFKALYVRKMGLKALVWILTTGSSYLVYKIFDFALDTTHTVQLFLFTMVVSIISLSIYFILSLVWQIDEATFLFAKITSLFKKYLRHENT